MRGSPKCRSLLVAAVSAQLAAGLVNGRETRDSLTVAGEQLYLSGMRADGSTLAAVVQHDVDALPAAVGCASCHGRSGLGLSEGTLRALPITSDTLFRPAIGGAPRPAYSDATLLRAITAGVSSSGRRLDALMPRYQLTRADSVALLGYLHVLGAAPAPGVTPSHIDIATVITADAPQASRQALQEVITRFVAIKNAGMRREARRSAAARRHELGERRDRAFRVWRHEFWTLGGERGTWRTQLDRYYRARPPFAVLSGTGGRWAPVHEFCRDLRVPCLLPLASPPPSQASDFYSIYFSEGPGRDARVTARHVLKTTPPEAAVLIVTSDDETMTGTRAAFEQTWSESRRKPADLFILGAATRSGRHWHEVINHKTPDILIAWMSAPELAPLLDAVAQAGRPLRLYTAESFTPLAGIGVPAASAHRIRHVYPYRLPARSGIHFPREGFWLKSQGLSGLEPIAAAHALFACHALGEALMGIENTFSREYLVEQLEHMLDAAPMTSIYPVTGLGRGQRILTRGAYVIRPTADGAAAESEWVQP